LDLGGDENMGPLVPEIIGDELNFIVAILIGIAFGFILEQAGFSTSKKLVGLFYGYDFTVLRVFFTAGITAMIGVIILANFGLLDTSLIFINPTFLWSAIIGGLIMGLGFVIGGFCPGTSICAAAIGKIDAMIFVAGSFIGVFIFAESYPLLETLYKSANWGGVRLFESLGVSQSLVAFLLVLVALGAFWAVRFVENKVNGIKDYKIASNRKYLALTGVALLIGLSAFFLNNKKDTLLTEASSIDFSAVQIPEITSDELAIRLMDRDMNYFIFDLRPEKEFDSIPLPNSIRITLDNLFEREYSKQLSVRNRKSVFISEDGKTAAQGAFIAAKLGYTGSYLLKGGFNEFSRDIINFEKPSIVKTKREADTYIFRESAKTAVSGLIKENKLKKSAPVSKAPKRQLKGC
jgi:rhodanese-related sulfurtransferase